MTIPLLSVSNLHTYFFTRREVIKAVHNLNFTIGKGEIFGLVGESGCGKTLTALSIMRLVPSPGRIVGGSITFEDKDLATLSAQDMQYVRGGRIGMIFQEPLTSLNPVLRIGDQIAENLLAHKGIKKEEARRISTDLLRKVGFDNPEKRYFQYPHQLSGGQRQRVLIAIAMACHPALIIADEPTTALDVTIERQILSLLQKLVAELDLSMLFITHNLHLIQRIGHKIGIMYAGRMVEQGRVADFFRHPLHPYSSGLLQSMPDYTRDCGRLRAIPGSVPRFSEIPEGCKFHPRCARVMERCTLEEPAFVEVDNERWVRCFLYQN
jgi:oligopeptide/dipeptide ABC transporter ATP-binding protein